MAMQTAKVATKNLRLHALTKDWILHQGQEDNIDLGRDEKRYSPQPIRRGT